MGRVIGFIALVAGYFALKSVEVSTRNAIAKPLLVLSKGKTVPVYDSHGKVVEAIELDYPFFPEINYGQWSAQVDRYLKVKMNAYAERLTKAGYSVIPSPAPGAIGRLYGSKTSQHYAGEGQLIRGIDVMLPAGPSLKEAAQIAREVGFTGIGVYPNWKPFPGLHLDVRTGRSSGNPATWARIGGEYVAIERGFV